MRTSQRRPFDVMAVAILVAIGATMTLVESAAVVDNDKKQLLMNNDEFDKVVYGGCDDGRVINCRTLPLYNYTELPPPPVGANADIQQDENCPYKNLERHLRCVDIFTRRCLTPKQRQAFYSLYSVPTLDMQELCTVNGPYWDEYQKHAECLRTVHTEYVKCGRQHQHELSTIIGDQSQQQQQVGDDVSLVDPDQLNLRHLCKSFRGHLRCVQGIVRSMCGPDTEAFASQFLSQMASSLLKICDEFGNQAVSDGSYSSPSSASQLSSIGMRALVAGSVFLTGSTVFLAATSRWWRR